MQRMKNIKEDGARNYLSNLNALIFFMYWMCNKTQGYINSWVCAVCSDMIIATSDMNRKNRH
jgi:hypothetical protein